MEAESYLSSGFGIRLALEKATSKCKCVGDLANVTQPSRLKGILVSPEHGTPFLAATQVFDLRPTPRKFLALKRMPKAEDCFVDSGTILVTRSGSVGRATVAYDAHKGTVISDDLLRVRPHDDRLYGWLYAYLQSHQVRAMATSAHYGHIIKHLETSHLNSLPIPEVDDDVAEKFNDQFDRIIILRNNAYRSMLEAEHKFAEAVGDVNPDSDECAFSVSVTEMASGRRRLEGAYHHPLPRGIFSRFQRWERLSDVSHRVWWMSRFKRVYGDAGIPYKSADTLFTINPSDEKRILVRPDDNHSRYFVKEGWLVMACSGQTYGLNGATVMATRYDEGTFFSHDLIRIKLRNDRVRPGYVLVALTHPTHGRPLLIREAYGTSIPHLDPGDVADFPIVRLPEKVEDQIANLAEAATAAKSDADLIEQQMGTDAGEIIENFIKA